MFPCAFFSTMFYLNILYLSILKNFPVLLFVSGILCRSVSLSFSIINIYLLNTHSSQAVCTATWVQKQRSISYKPLPQVLQCLCQKEPIIHGEA